jgi:hypothetical protein
MPTTLAADAMLALSFAILELGIEAVLHDDPLPLSPKPPLITCDLYNLLK